MIILGLGSNKGDRLKYLNSAIDEIGKIASNIKRSAIYESKALLTENAPPEWNLDFLNTAISCDSNLSPNELLQEIKKIEEKLGRISLGYWSPREIDIDILAYNQLVVKENDLIIPHQFLTKRDFAIIPFADVAPDWIHPEIGLTASELSQSFNNKSLHKIS